MANAGPARSLIGQSTDIATGYVGSIPVRNLWLLMLYASDFFRALGSGDHAVEKSPDDLPNLVAEVLARAVELRFRRQLTYGYQPSEAVLCRVRGRIDALQTERHQWLARGRVACRFDRLTLDTPRNRFVRAALERIGRLARRELAHRCFALAADMKAMGVSGAPPTRTQLSADRFGRHDATDRAMVAAAKLAFDLSLPTEDAGRERLLRPDREDRWVRCLFEKAVGGFYDVVLGVQGWKVQRGLALSWQIDEQTAGIGKILPGMRTDIVLQDPGSERRIVIDTKFNEILTLGWFREETLRSAYLYQIYAYLLSQTGRSDSLADKATGILLHPAVGTTVDETVVIQGHAIRFATVDLARPAADIRLRLLELVGGT